MGRDVLHGTGEVIESASDDARRGGEGNGETSKDESSREFKRFLHNQVTSSSSDAPPGLRGSLLSVRFRADPHFFSSFFAIALSMVSTSDNSPRSPYLSPKRDTRPALVITAVLTPWKKGVVARPDVDDVLSLRASHGHDLLAVAEDLWNGAGCGDGVRQRFADNGGRRWDARGDPSMFPTTSVVRF